ncbi:outer membrane protein assembly factor BamA [Pararhodobacter sp. SW119]|uniref:outer membrane protein assembly factor BamA n=1 Tax=Pararhodobacter sp. SW119 TaxID=2780075 RepID=UPI001ADFC64E|nr:outer membrane protein assembly factor BamA [Pararhodobacter sp. SW119]
MAVLAAIAALSLLAAAPSAAQTYNFSTIAVEGNRQIDAQSVAGFARIARNRSLSAAELNAAYQRVASSGFFRSVDFIPSGNRLVIRVEEYPILNQVNFEGNRRVNDDVLREVVVLRAGRVFSPAQAEADATAVAEVYAAQGRLAARVNPRLIERGDGRVDLAFEIVEGRVVEVQRVSFVGNRSFSDRRLRNALQTSQAGVLSFLFQSDNFNEARVANDRQLLQDFYLSRGFVDAQVTAAVTEVARERDAAFVTFTVREGQQYRLGQTSVVSEIAGIDPAPYRAEMGLRAGAIFSPVVLDSAVDRMERVGERSGERFLRVEPRLSRNERARTIDVEFAIVRGERIFVERIDIQGNATTQDRVIRRQFDLAEGDPLNPRKIREAATRIRELNYFADANVDVQGGSAPDQAIVDVQVEETTTGSLGLGVSYGAREGIGANIQFSESNFLGRGQRVSLNLSTERRARSFNLSFVEPALLGRDLEFGIRAGLSATTGSRYSQFDTRMLQFSPSLTVPVSEFGRLGVRYSIARDEIRNVDPAASPRIQQDALLGSVVTSSVGFSYIYDTRRIGPDPDRGFVLRFDSDIAGLGGDRKWARSTALVGYEHRILGGDVTLRAEAEAGGIWHRSGASRITERFELGPDQIRGFRPYGIGPRDANTLDGLGGNYYAVARLEAEFPLGLPQEYNISGGAFFDVGSLWGVDSPGVTLLGGNRSLRATAGLSLFWDTPIGPLRFNFSTPVRREDFDRIQRFDLTISSRF